MQAATWNVSCQQLQQHSTVCTRLPLVDLQLMSLLAAGTKDPCGYKPDSAG